MMIEQVEKLWKRYSEYKSSAEQDEFVKLYMYDRILVPAYKDLQVNWTDEHGELFIKGMNKILEELGIHETDEEL